jgi:hypothetical protein
MKTLWSSGAVLAALVSVSLCLAGRPAAAQADFRRGDANQDGKVDFADYAFINRYLFCQGPRPDCYAAYDWDNGGILDGNDTYMLFRWLWYYDMGFSSPGPFVPGPDPEGPGGDYICDTCLSYQLQPSPKLAEIALGFEEPIFTPGEPGTYQMFVTLTTSNNSVDSGADGWSLSLGVENLILLSVTLAGEAAGTGRSDPFNQAEIVDPEKVVGGKAQGEGVVSAVVGLVDWPNCTGSLPREGTERLLGLTVALKDPAAPGRIFFEDGKVYKEGQPIANMVILQGTAQTPTLGELAISLPGGRIVPGDANGDGGLDISDAVSLLGFLFLGSAKGLPCGDGSAIDPGNISLLDWQPDGAIDISDAVAMLSFLFLGGEAHALAVPGEDPKSCIRIAGCPDFCGE